jgi:hypothetical protein
MVVSRRTIFFFLALLLEPVNSFLVRAATNTRLKQHLSNDDSNQIDVSDLGLTMDDLNAPLPAGVLESIAMTGYESTSMIPSVQDDACMWTENGPSMKVTLAIPGLRGQPSACLSVLCAKNTVSISAFGRVVWSTILRGEVVPETFKFEARDGPDMTPVLELDLEKADASTRWDGFILQIGEDSLL